jgi:hypothetical protein
MFEVIGERINTSRKLVQAAVSDRDAEYIINRTFVTLMMDAGMDSAIIDPLDKKIMATIKTADMLLGHDQFCMNYLKGVRAGAIES